MFRINKENNMLQNIMDINDNKKFRITLNDISTNEKVADIKGYFANSILYVEFNFLEIIGKDINSEEKTIQVTTDDFKNIFKAVIPIKNYEYESLSHVEVERLSIDSNYEIDCNENNLKTAGTAQLLYSCDGVCFSIASN